MGLNAFKDKHKIKAAPPGWFGLKNGQSVLLSFPEDPSADWLVVEHVSPDNYRKRAVCTGENCWACEQRSYGWNQKIKLYVPVVSRGRGYVFSQGIGVNSLIHDLVQHRRKHGTIKDVVFEVSRKGEGKRSAYSAIPTQESAPVQKTKVDITKLINNIEYSKQEQYFKE